MPTADQLVIEDIRHGKPDAWTRLIGQYEGRLLAYVDTRLRNRAASEDVVQETFIGFLTSLPNYDDSRPLESWLFTIAAHKLTDHLRREGRRPALALSTTDGSDGDGWDLPGSARGASSMARSGERRSLEEETLATLVGEEIARWRERGDWIKLRCIELLFVRGTANKEAAELLDLSEQQVANFKSDFLGRLRTLVKRQQLNEDIFPELYESN